MPEKSETDLIAAGKLGDTAAIAELFERYYASSLVVARRILRAEEEAQDAVQSAYLSAFRHFNSFRGDAAFKTWITRIVKNYCLMRLRQPWLWGRAVNWDALNGSERSFRLVSHAPTPEASAFRRELASALTQAASRLPKTLCEVFQLHAVSGLSLKQVATKMGLTLPAAKSRLFRANARMRESLEPVWSPRLNHTGARVYEVESEAA